MLLLPRLLSSRSFLKVIMLFSMCFSKPLRSTEGPGTGHG